MGEGLDSWFEELERGLDEMFEAEDREMLAFAKELRLSRGYRRLNDSARGRINLYIKAYEGDEEAVLALSLNANNESHKFRG